VCLVLILLMGCVVMAAGPALARYRMENKDTMELGVRPLEQIYLGKMVKASDLAQSFEKEDMSRQAGETAPEEETTVPTEETQAVDPASETEESQPEETTEPTEGIQAEQTAPQILETQPTETTAPTEAAVTEETTPEETQAEEAAATPEAAEEMVFDQNSRARWETVGDVSRLIFAVANGRVVRTLDPTTMVLTSMEEFALEDQNVQIQVLGNLEIWDGKETFSLKLVAPSEEDPTNLEEYTATARRIKPDTVLHRNFGDGWIFTFADEEGEPFSRTLKGGTFSVLELQLVLQGQLDADVGCLLLQVSGEK
jgi:hypothetical protein